MGLMSLYAFLNRSDEARSPIARSDDTLGQIVPCLKDLPLSIITESRYPHDSDRFTRPLPTDLTRA